MNRSEAKALVRHALLKNEWLRVHYGPDYGDNCYTEKWSYKGSNISWRGRELVVEWGSAWMQVVIPRQAAAPLSSSWLGRLDAYLQHELGWEVEHWDSIKGERLYMTEMGTELLISFVGGSMVCNTALPAVSQT